MSTNSRPGRSNRVSRDTVYALALQRACAPLPDTLPAAGTSMPESTELHSRRGRARPRAAQVPPT